MTKQQLIQLIGIHINEALKSGMPCDDVMIVLELHKLGLYKAMSEQPIIMQVRKPLPPGQQ